MKLLLAEDTEDLAFVMKDLLGSMGYEVLWAQTGQEVVDHLELTDVACIIMDITMPVMDGIEATKILRQRGLEVPIFAWTGLCDTRETRAIVEVGCTACFQKPMQIDELVVQIEKLKV